MRRRFTIVGLAGLMLLAASWPCGAQQNPFRLKEPNQQKLCVSCHNDFEQKLKVRFVHGAIKTGECSGCHSPHVSTQAKLLAADTRELCAGCHDTVIPANAKSAHKVVAEGQCLKCHDPHGSNNAANLVASGTELCATCHKALVDGIAAAKFKHAPVAQGCQTCHGPHGSDKAERLLKADVPALCIGCHKPDAPAFVTRHKRYPVGKADCTSCHDPHGSNQPALLLNTVHPPLANGACAQCHEAPDSATPFATKKPGYQLCKTCHNDMVTATLAMPRLHWPVADRTGCVNCHNPHASKQPKLVKKETRSLCANCHEDTVRAMAGITVKHAPVDGGNCTACHSPHGASATLLMDKPSVNEICTACHDYAQHSQHPIGEKAIDPRNANLRVDCLSCHKGHGTQFKHMLLAETNLELCTQCHQQYQR